MEVKVERPKEQNYAVEAALRGSGKIGTSFDYLQNTDPVSYYYEKLKAENSPYLRADMWAEAAKRGESATLLSMLMNQNKATINVDGQAEQSQVSQNKYYDKWLEWEGYSDYDSYMLALTIPTLDDTKKIERTTTLEDGTEYSFGKYTDREWGEKIFEDQVAHWEAQKVEDDKKRKTFWEHIGDFCKTVFVDIPLRIIGGVVDFFGDIYNLFEGVVNMFADFGGDGTDLGAKFLWAFQNDDPLSLLSEDIRKAAYQLEYNTLLVDAVEAYKQGYRGPDSGVYDVGHTWIGQTVSGISQSIGYMLPSIVIQFIPGVGQATTALSSMGKVGAYAAKNIGRIIFYTGLFSGNIKNTVNTYKANGVSYRDINAGTVVANAAIKAVAQYAIEDALSWIIGASHLDRLFGQTQQGLLPKSGVKAPTRLGSAARVIGGGLKDAIKEGLEEFLQDSSDGLIDLVFGANGDTIFKQMGEETLNIGNLLNSFVAGALTSVIMGSVSNAKFIWKRGYGIDANGQAYKLGIFESIDYSHSLQLMNEWNDTVQDTTAKEDVRADAAMKLAAAYDALSQMYQAMGESEMVKANKTLLAQAAVEETKKSALMKLSAPEYGTKLMTDFMAHATVAQTAYLTQKAQEAIKKAAEREAAGLKEGLVTKFKSIFTRNSKVDVDIGVDEVIQEEVIDMTDKVKAEAIVAHDGTFVGFSGDVLFVPEEMLNNISEALECAEQREAIKAVTANLSQAQKKLLLQQFEKVTGTSATIEQAVAALLFDKNFYCSVLFLSAERKGKGYSPEAFQLLATLDQVAKNKLYSPENKGNLREDVLRKTIEKIQENMRGGLINFCTKYAYVDLGEISNEVLPSEYKEVIRNNPNFLYTELINKCLYNYKTISEQDRNRLVKLVENMTTLGEAEKQVIITALDSGDAELIADAGRAIEFARRNDPNMNKIIYLPASTSEQMVQTVMDGIAEYTGISFDDWVAGNVDATKFTPEFAQYLQNGQGQLDVNDRNSRMRFLDNMLFEKSSHMLTVDSTGTVWKVVDKHDFCKERYTGKNGLKNLKQDVNDGKVKTVQDISRLKLDPAIGKIKLAYTTEHAPNERASYNPSTKTILFSGIASSVDSIMHEVTHIAQDLVSTNKDRKSLGSTANRFDSLPEATQKSIIAWLKKHSPIYYALTQEAHLSVSEVIYFALDGELRARTTADILVRECGFVYNNDKTKLIAPDGTTWNLQLKKTRGSNIVEELNKAQEAKLRTIDTNINMFQGILQSAQNQLNTLQPGTTEYAAAEEQVKRYQSLVSQLESEKAKYTQTDNKQADAALTREQRDELKNDPEVQQFMKDGFLKKNDGTPIVWYRGSDEGAYDTMNSGKSVRRLGEFYTTSYDEAGYYGNERGIITNVTREETMVIDMKGEDFNTITDKLSDKAKAFNERLYNKYKVFRDALAGHVEPTVSEAEQIIKANLGAKANTWDAAVKEAMEKYKLNHNQAVKFIIGTEWLQPGMHPGIEGLMPLAIAQGKSAIVVRNTVDGTGNTVTEMVLLKSGKQMRVTTDDDYYADSEVGQNKKDRSYVSDTKAKGTNLENWTKKGKRIVDTRVQNFVISTTKDFDKLSPTMQRMINDATLTSDTMKKYVATAAHIDDFTFQAIAKYFFNNDIVADMTYKDMLVIFQNLTQFAAMSGFIEEGKNTPMTLEEMQQKYAELKERMKTDHKLAKDFGNANELLGKKKIVGTKGVFHQEVDIDISQLNTLFFRLYDGTLDSLYQINNIAKTIAYHQPAGDVSLTENDKAMSTKGSKTTYENAWKTRAKYARVQYDIDTDTEVSLEGVDLRDKVKTIQENYQQTFIKQMQKVAKDATAENKAQVLQQYKQGLIDLNNKLRSATEEEINQMYLAALGVENNQISEDQYKELVTRQTHISKEEQSTANQYNALVRRGNAIARTDLANRKANFDKLPDNLKQYFVRTKDGYKFKMPGKYSDLNMTPQQISKLNSDLAQIRQMFADERAKAKETQRELKEAKRVLKQTQERLDRMARRNFNQKGQTTEEKTTTKKTMKEKVVHKYKVHIHETNFSFESNNEANGVVKGVLETQFSKRGKSNVQGLISENQDQVVTSGKEFFAQNAGIFLNASLSEIEDAAAWFLDSNLQMQNATEEEFRIYQAVKQLFLGYVLSQIKADGAYAGFNANLKARIENELHKMASTAGTVLSHQNEILALINPLESMSMADMVIDGVSVTPELKATLFDAIMSNDINKIKAAEQAIYDFIKKNSPKGQSILRKVTSLRSMFMLSSPLTWLRNKVSNMMLKRLYRISDKIGQKLLSGKHIEGQLRLNKAITPEIQDFINKNFLDNNLFDSFVGNLSKYNPSDITERKNISEKATKEQIMAHLVLKSMYAQYYNNETFKSPMMKSVHQFILKMLSDNNYVRASAVRTFGKILAEKGYDLSNGEVTDSIMNDFANAIGFAMAEYMHSDNFFHDIERIIGERSELGHFVYKLFMPYAASSWNWFKAMIKLSPIGLARSIVQMARLEKNVARAQQQFLAGKTQITGELAEYMIKRDFGQGVVGTILWGVGIALACLGFVRLEDDDYGTPKLRVGNIEVDISSIFGSSSLLAGAALVTQIQKNGFTWKGIEKGLNGMFDVWSDQLPIMDIVQMDMFSEGTFSLGLDQLGTILLSFIPNGVKWLAGGTYTGTLKKTTFLDRAMANIPFLANLVPKKVDPYTGKYLDDGFIGIFNRLVPYFSYHAASKNESNSTALGLNKQMLNGKYVVNGESFNITGKRLSEINQTYGQWNAVDLTKFYDNQLAVKVKVGNGYKMLRYNQMTADQQKKAVQTIMSNNAELAKIIAWTTSGHKYYASADIYSKLVKAGYHQNIYRGTKGFVK